MLSVFYQNLILKPMYICCTEKKSSETACASQTFEKWSKNKSIIKHILTFCGHIFFPSLPISQSNKPLKIYKHAEKISGEKRPQNFRYIHKATVCKAHAITNIIKTPNYPWFILKLWTVTLGRRYNTIDGRKAK